jgi:hypothetical protein
MSEFKDSTLAKLKDTSEALLPAALLIAGAGALGVSAGKLVNYAFRHRIDRMSKSKEKAVRRLIGTIPYVGAIGTAGAIYAQDKKHTRDLLAQAK